MYSRDPGVGGQTRIPDPKAWTAVIATIHDVTKPEVRGTAQSLLSFAENFGSAVAPWLAGLIAIAYSLHVAILVTCLSTWLLCGLLFGVTAWLIPGDVKRLRATMRARAGTEQNLPYSSTA